ncbi:MAG: transposase [Myxococcota bacterium]
MGPITSLAFPVVIGRPDRFEKARDVAACLEVVVKRDPSGKLDPSLGISKCGDGFMRRLLVQCSTHILALRGSSKKKAARFPPTPSSSPLGRLQPRRPILPNRVPARRGRGRMRARSVGGVLGRRSRGAEPGRRLRRRPPGKEPPPLPRPSTARALTEGPPHERGNPYFPWSGYWRLSSSHSLLFRTSSRSFAVSASRFSKRR